MVVIRLSRVGKKNSPAYRVVVADKQRAVKRKFIEVIGHYNPTLNPKELVINKERADFWIAKGAQPSDTVRNLMVDLGILKKTEKINKVYGKPVSKKAAKEGPKEAAAETVAEAPEAAAETTTEAPEAAAEEVPAEEPASSDEASTEEIAEAQATEESEK